ncbi:unnamed protein product [Parajaminaea phylloscopi]
MYLFAALIFLFAMVSTVRSACQGYSAAPCTGKALGPINLPILGGGPYPFVSCNVAVTAYSDDKCSVRSGQAVPNQCFDPHSAVCIAAS